MRKSFFRKKIYASLIFFPSKSCLCLLNMNLSCQEFLVIFHFIVKLCSDFLSFILIVLFLILCVCLFLLGSFLISSVQFSCSVLSDSLRPHESQHARPPCPSPSPRVHSHSRPSSQWCHPAISFFVIPSPPAPNSSQHQSLFQWINSSHEVAKVLEFQL